MHTIVLTHLWNGAFQAYCRECDEGSVGPERRIRGFILGHRMLVYPELRKRLLDV